MTCLDSLATADLRPTPTNYGRKDALDPVDPALRGQKSVCKRRSLPRNKSPRFGLPKHRYL